VNGPAGEGPHAPAQEGFADWLTFAFATPEGDTCGLAGLEPGTGRGDEPRCAGHALLLRQGVVAAARAEGPVRVPSRDWAQARAAGVRIEVEEPLGSWSVGFEHSGGAGFELRFTGLGEPAVLDPEGAFAHAARVQGHDRLCRVSGTVRSGGGQSTVECLGQRGHRWGARPAGRLALLRGVDLWLDERLAVVVAAARATRAKPDAEVVAASVLEGDPPVAAGVEEARLSTTYDGHGQPVRASVELWPAPDADIPRRAAGEAIGSGTLRVDDGHELVSTFFRWWMEGRAGVGHYALLRRT